MSLPLALVVGLAAAQPTVTAAAVLEAVDARVPELAAARLRIAEKEAELLKTQGAFDPVLSGKLDRKDQDPYRWTTGDVALTAPLAVGPELQLGHRLGVGKLPVYAGEDATAERGELRLQATVPLLQDLGMTEARAQALVKEAAVVEARAKARDAEVKVTAKAALSWAKWVAAAEKLALAERLAELAERRQAALERQVAEGAKARIDALDNARALAERQAAAADAAQELAVASQALSLWFRDDAMAPRVPARDQAPPPPEAALAPLPDRAPALAQARAHHPRLAALDAVVQAAEAERRRARSVLLPELDARGAVARDFGVNGPGPVETRIGAQVKVPLAFRKGRGAVRAADAALARLAEERRGLSDAVAAQVHQAWEAADGARRRWEQAARSVALAEEVAELERRAFRLGASDLFRVVKREEAVAKATKDLIDARYAWRLAVVSAAAAAGQPVTAERLE